MRRSRNERSVASACLALGVWLLAGAADAGERTTLTFPSKDRLEITADLYPGAEAGGPFIVLFHQAGWSRGEYLEIAPRLNELGFGCLAVDQRSGKGVNGVANETARRAAAAGKETRYVDALPDVEAALEYAREHHARGPLIAWGSSYSASLVLKVAGDRPALVDGALAFAPGEYFVEQGKPATWIRSSAARIQAPVFITSARRETQAWSAILEAIPSPKKVAYVPDTAGNHGSRALWSRFQDSDGYWKAVSAFLQTNFAR
jgi:alpha-beta hydrolase superfamily lysophospholipase